MERESSDPLTSALAVARACWEMANDGVERRQFTAQAADAIAKAAHGAARSLDDYRDSCAATLDESAARDLLSARVDLDVVAQIAGLAAAHALSPRDAVHIAQSARYTAEQAAKRLDQLARACS